MLLKLATQSGEGFERRLPFCFLMTTSARWLPCVLRMAMVICGLIAFGVPLNAVEDTYTLESERSPNVDYYHQEKNRRIASERQEQFRKTVSIQHAVGEDVPLAFVKDTGDNNGKKISQPQSESDGIVQQGLLLLIAAFLTSILAVSVIAPAFIKNLIIRLKPWSGRTGVATGVADKVRVEDEYFTEFLTAFQAANTAASNTSTFVKRTGAEEVSETFRANATRLLASQYLLIENIVNATSDAERVRLLGDLRRELNAFKSGLESAEFRPARQMAAALEGLLKQLSNKVANATRSTLRTVSSGFQLLGELTRPGIRSDILTNPPLRFLTVDDDLISRTAIALALKKVFNQPDIADNGIAASALAAKNDYDVIFLDVQMPGMDGYELCSKIHECPTNKDTPVVFVTCMSDFDARAKSLLAVGSDLIGKPFLTFEITVKALTLALERRIKACDTMNANAGSPVVAMPEVSAVVTNVPPTTPIQGVESSSSGTSTDAQDASLRLSGVNVEASEKAESLDTIESAFKPGVANKFAFLKKLVRSMSGATNEITRQELLAEFYLGLHELSSEVAFAMNPPARRVSAALEGLIRKLLESPLNWTHSMLLTIANAVDLMDDLSADESNPDLLADLSVRILAVDDDPISRRAMSGALQVAFMKPVSVDSGDAAFLIASEEKFDLIFMDIQMPGLNGFETCSMIRDTMLNARTPIVFVSGQHDSQTRNRVAECGGNGVISKPFLTAEMTVKALTLVLRGRISQSDSPETSPAVCGNVAAL